MNLKVAIPLATAVVLGTVSAIIGSRLVNNQAAPLTFVDTQNVDVLVAVRELAPGTTISAEDFKSVKITPEAVPGAIVTDTTKLVGRVTQMQVIAGQTIIEPMLAPDGAAGGLIGLIEPGMRAMTIGVNTESGVAGFIEPGSRIDLVARVSDPQNGKQMTRTIVQNVTVIAVGSRLSPGQPVVEPGQPAPPPANNVTLLVTPQQAEVLDLAAAGQTRLVLRSALDSDLASVSGATQDSLNTYTTGPQRKTDEEARVASNKVDPFDNSAPAPTTSRAGEATVRTITIIRNGVETTVNVPERPKQDPSDFSGGDLNSSYPN